MAVDVLKYISKNDIERMWYEDEILAEIDQEAEIAHRVKGIAKNLIKIGLNNNQISESTGLTEEEVADLR